MRLLGSDVVLFAADLLLTFVLLKATLFAGVVLLVRALARRVVGVHGQLWTAAFIGLLLLPALAFVVPRAELQLFGFPTILWTLDAGAAARLIGGGVPALQTVTPPAAPLASWLVAVWAVGVAWNVGLFIRDIAQVRTSARRGAQPDARMAGEFALACATADVRFPVRLVLAPVAFAPFTFGWRRPVVVLPAASAAWTAARLHAVLAHELAHIHRTDYARLLLIEAVCALFWLNPLVRVMRRTAYLDQDLACDAAAVRAGVPSTEYARHLLDLARTGRAAATAVALPLLRRSTLRARIAAVLQPADAAASRASLRAACAAPVVVVFTLLLASANLWICDDAPDTAVIAATTD
jgi:beta-lactamase regulating signal transducer with metallopeptidase domain